MGKCRVEDLHADDVENLVKVRVQLQALAEHGKDKKLTLTDMADKIGRSHWFLHVLWADDTWPGYWKFSTFHDLCRAVDAYPAINHEFDVEGPMMAIARGGNPHFLGAAVQEMLEITREMSGMSVEDVAEAAGVHKSALWRALNSEDPRLSTLMRYARVYGRPLKFGVVL